MGVGRGQNPKRIAVLVVPDVVKVGDHAEVEAAMAEDVERHEPVMQASSTMTMAQAIQPLPLIEWATAAPARQVQARRKAKLRL